MIARQFRKEITLLAAAALLAGTAAMAQTAPQTGQQPNPPGQLAPVPGQPNDNTYNPAASGPAMNDEDVQALEDRMFLLNTLERDDTIVQMSRLAQQRSPSADVKQYGQQMVRVRTELSNQLRPLARRLGVKAPAGPTKKEDQRIAKLEALSGRDFNRAYIHSMEIEQQHTLRDFKHEARATDNPNVRTAAKLDAPMLSQPLEALARLAQAHNVTLASNKR